MSKATECYASCNDHKCVRAGHCMGLAGCRESEEERNKEVASLRGAQFAALAESQATIAKLREALKNLHALVEGECPSLLEDDHHDMLVREALAIPQVKEKTE